MTKRTKKQVQKMVFYILLENDLPVEVDSLIYATRNNEIASDTIGNMMVRTYFSGIAIPPIYSKIHFVTHLLEPDKHGPDRSGKHWFRHIDGSPKWSSWPREQAMARHAQIVQAIRDGTDLPEGTAE
jgi:hypothetical protein